MMMMMMASACVTRGYVIREEDSWALDHTICSQSLYSKTPSTVQYLDWLGFPGRRMGCYLQLLHTLHSPPAAILSLDPAGCSSRPPPPPPPSPPLHSTTSTSTSSTTTTTASRYPWNGDRALTSFDTFSLVLR